MEATSDGLWDWHIKSDKCYFSPSYYRMLGYEVCAFPAEYNAWNHLIHPDDREHAARMNMDCVEGRIEIFELEYRMKAKNGEWCWILARGKCVERDPQGRALRLVGTHVDITERKRAEDERMQWERQKQRLQKAESLGRMAGAIAHHFNNQLQVVMMNLNFAMRGKSTGEFPTENLTGAMESARKAAEVSTLMLTYLGQTVVKREPLDLSDACLQSLPMIRAAMPKDVALETDLPVPGPAIQASASQMQQVLTNLVTNAWESSGGGKGAIRLTVKTVSASDISPVNRFPFAYQIQDSAYACLEVVDAGCGIDGKDIEKLFDPFFSSKFTGRGLGLPVVLGIVRAHSGVVTVESEPGRGSVFRVFIPVSAEAVPHKPDSVVQSPQKAGGGTVLVVDDEMNLRKVVATAIKSMGFTVLTGQDGVEAVELFRQHQDEIRLVLCDLTMPRMDGWETLAALRKLEPDIPVILSSGYSEAQTMAGNHPEQPQAFLSKPYEFEKLSDAIFRVMAKGK